MRVYVVRHGAAAALAAGGGDAGRPLTRDGQAEVSALGRGLRVQGVALDRLLASPLLRAQQTAALLAKALGGPAPETWAALGVDADPEAILAGLAGQGEGLALVGHQPTLGQLVTLAIAGRVAGGAALGTGSVARLDFEDRPRPGSGRLVWLMSAAQLGRLSDAGR